MWKASLEQLKRPLATTVFSQSRRLLLASPLVRSQCFSSSTMPYHQHFDFTAFEEKDTCNELPDFVAELVKKYSSLKQTSAPLEMLIRSGKGELLGQTFAETQALAHYQPGGYQLQRDRILIQKASFVQQEIPIRLAYRIRGLDQIPLLRDMEAVQKVKKIYIDSFLKLIQFPPIVTKQDEQTFAKLLEHLYNKHSGVMVQMARGAYQLRAALKQGKIKGVVENQDSELEFERMHLCHNFLDRFYTSRIGIRVLAGQYLALREKPDPNYVGMVHLRASPSAIVRRAAQDVTMMCQRSYGGIAPKVEITGRLDLNFPYIPTYLHYIVLELLKNAVRATVEQHTDKTNSAVSSSSSSLPPVTVVVADGQDNEDVVIKISDEGGGIPRSQIKKIWSYLFTTANPSVQEAFLVEGKKDHDEKSPMAGLGYGLPIARSYARYFGGDLDLISMENYGTDAFVHLNRLGDSKEPLPV